MTLRGVGRVPGHVGALPRGSGSLTHRAYGPYALSVTLFNVSRRLILRAYCMVIRGIPVHSEGILGGSRDYTMSFYFHSIF
eukprot:COSAG02_NODE_696_length_18385_cov_48.260855_13_plen_81_part_00